MKKKILAIGYTFRTIDNFLPLLQKLKNDGNSVSLVLFPNMDDADHFRMKNFRNVKIVYERSIAKLNDWLSPSFDEICNILEMLLNKIGPDVILLDDILHYPSNAILPALLELNLSNRPLVVAFQHGFDQHWRCYNRNFACDYFFSYGSAYQSYFKNELKIRVLPTGLCKVDRLRTVPTTESGYILFVAQDEYSMAPPSDAGKVNCYEQIEKILSKLSSFYGLPVIIKPHPSYPWPKEYSHKFNIKDPNADPIQFVSQANFILTTGSTLSLEALSLKKKTVILPSKTGYAFRDSPILAKTYDYYGVKQILDQYSSLESKLTEYLDSFLCNWNSFDATARSIRTLDHILSVNSLSFRISANDLPPIFSLRRLTKNKREIYIWGAGGVGRSLLTYLQKHQVKVKGFIDSDPSKIGTQIDSLDVSTLPHLLALSKKGKKPYILIGSSYVQEIECILQKNGLALKEDYQPAFPTFELN